MSLRLRRGTNAERAARVFDLAEPIWVTDKEQLWIGSGTGSVDPIASYAGTGLSYSYNGTSGGKLSVNLGDLNTDSLPQGGTNRYFSNQLAQDAVAEMLSNGTQTGITFTYNPMTHALDVNVGADAFLLQIDTSPKLGGDLDLNSFNITGTGNIDITGDVSNGGVLLSGNDISTSNPIDKLTLKSSFEFEDGRLTVNSSSGSYPSYLRTYLDNQLGSVPASRFFVQRGTKAAPQALQPFDEIYTEGWLSYDGNNYVGSAYLTILGSAVSAGNVPGNVLLYSISNDNPSTSTSGIHIAPSGISVGHLSTHIAEATLDVGGFAKLTPLDAEPSNLSAGIIAVADNNMWDPCSVGGGLPYPAFYNGSIWLKMFS